jgi:hypothetical protein
VAQGRIHALVEVLAPSGSLETIVREAGTEVPPVGSRYDAERQRPPPTVFSTE